MHRLHGRVTDAATGQPVSGAAVFLSVDRGAANRQREAETATAADGTWLIETPLFPRNARWTRLFAEAEGYAVAAAEMAALRATTQGATDIEWNAALEPQAPIEGRVVDDTGAVVAGALVFFEGNPDPLSAAFAPGMLRSGADGTFRTTGFAAGARLLAKATADDHLEGSSLPFEAPAIGVEIVLPAFDAAVEGIVVDSAGKPIAECPVAAWHTSQENMDELNGPGMMGRTKPIAAATSGEDGCFKLAVRSGRVIVGAGGMYLGSRMTAEFVTIPSKGKGSVHLVIPDPIELKGVVVEAGTDTPVSGAKVRSGWMAPAKDRTPWDAHESYSGADGRFSLPYYRFWATRGVAQSLECEPPSGLGFQPNPSGPMLTEEHLSGAKPVRIELPRPASIEGIVLMPDGSPAVGAQVDFFTFTFPEFASYRDWNESVLSDAEGKFRLPVRMSEELTVGARMKGYLAKSAVSVQSGKPTTGVVLKLEKMARISGMVKDPDGQPAKKATVVAAGSGWEKHSFAAGEDGTFELFVSGMTLKLTASGEDGTETEEPLEISVRSGEEKSGIELLLAAKSFLNGRVVDAEGKPVAGASLGYGDRYRVEVPRQALSAADGTFRLPGVPFVPDPRKAIFCWKDGYGRVQLPNVGNGASPLEIVLQARLQLTLVGAYADGEEVEDFSYVIVPSSPGSIAGEHQAIRGNSTDARAVVDLEPGPYRITARDTGERAGVALHPLLADAAANGKELPLAFAVPPEVRGIVEDASGKPVSGAQVQARLWFSDGEIEMGPGIGVGASVSAESGEDGRFTLGLWKGKWSLEAAKGAVRSAVVVFSIDSEPPPEQRLVVQPPGSARFRVSAVAGVGYDYTLSPKSDHSGTPFTPVPESGEWTVDNLRSGTWEVSLYPKGERRGVLVAAAQKEFDVEPGKESLVELEVGNAVEVRGRALCGGYPLRSGRLFGLKRPDVPLQHPMWGKEGFYDIHENIDATFLVIVPPGEYEIVYGSTIHGRLSVPAGSPTFESDIHLPLVRVDVVIALPGGIPVRGAEVRLLKEDGTHIEMQQDVNGTAVSLDCIPPGRLIAAVRLPDGRKFRGPAVDVGPGLENVATVSEAEE